MFYNIKNLRLDKNINNYHHIVEDILTNFVKEKYISSIIINMTEDMEAYDYVNTLRSTYNEIVDYKNEYDDILKKYNSRRYFICEYHKRFMYGRLSTCPQTCSANKRRREMDDVLVNVSEIKLNLFQKLKVGLEVNYPYHDDFYQTELRKITEEIKNILREIYN